MNFRFIKLTGEKKNLISNFLSLSVLQVLGYVFSFITFPYLARTLGVVNFGKIAFALSIITYFKCIVEWGFKYTAVRDIAQNRDNPHVVSVICSKVLCASFYLLITSSILLCLLVYLIPAFYEERTVILVTALIMPGYIFFPDWLFQAMERMKYITIINFIAKVLFTLFIFVIITEPDDYIYEPLLQACSQIIPGIISLLYAIRLFNLKLNIVSFNDVCKVIKEGASVFLTQFMPTLYNNFSVIILGVFGGQAAAGIFSSAYKFIGISEQLASVLSRTFFPFLARRMDKHGIYSKISAGISLIVSLTLLLGAKPIILLFFNEEYYDAIIVLRILAFGPFFLFLRNTFGMNGLVLIRKENIYRNIMVVSSLVGFVMTLLLVLKYGANGAGVTFVLTWAIMGVASYFQYNKCTNVK